MPAGLGWNPERLPRRDNERLRLHFAMTVALGLALVCGLAARATEAAVPLVFQPLKPGAVEPTGWIRDWALAAKSGITGNLDERATTYALGWSGKEFKAGGVKARGTGWPLEQCGYWLDGLVRLAYILHDPDLIAKAKSRLDPVVAGVLHGGASFIHWMPKDQLDDAFNNWSHSHMGRALVAYYQATGDQRILAALADRQVIAIPYSASARTTRHEGAQA